ncbi:hypothetical protein ACH5RR_037844 [Cinchona calisaya]|uniref:Uncharacterized protein n=1 Tax=Cinchona calisaya TaxID=153742 RepID=A0ABD2YC30_9GENT
MSSLRPHLVVAFVMILVSRPAARFNLALRELDMIKIGINLEVHSDLEPENNGVLPDEFATSVELRNMVKLRTRLALRSETLDRLIDELESGYWDNVGEYIPIPLHREIGFG